MCTCLFYLVHAFTAYIVFLYARLVWKSLCQLLSVWVIAIYIHLYWHDIFFVSHTILTIDSSDVSTNVCNYVYPIGSMYGVFTHIYHKDLPNVGKYPIHGSYGYHNCGQKDCVIDCSSPKKWSVVCSITMLEYRRKT